MAPRSEDLKIASDVRRWADARPGRRKRARTLMAAFGIRWGTKAARRRAQDALVAAGLDPRPSLPEADCEDWVILNVIGAAIVSDAPATQLVTYHEFNWTGGGEGEPVGEWLRCLKRTRSHDRQLIWSGDRIAGIVTFAGWLRQGTGFYEGWGSITQLPRPIERSTLLDDHRTRARFDKNGLKALQGSPITVDPELARALGELAGGLPTSAVPLDEPDFDAEQILWAGLHGLSPEAYIEAAVAARKTLWHKLGFPSAPERQRRLGPAGRVDLIAGDVVGEAKRAVTVRDGPQQIERYLDHLEQVRGRPRSRLRGVLLQVAGSTSDAVIERLLESPYRLELWSVTKGTYWRARQLS